MPAFFLSRLVIPLFLLTVVLPSPAKDVAVRTEAIRLLERANAVSRPSRPMPNHRQDVIFRSYGLDGSIKDGVFNGFFSGDIERYETSFGNYHGVSLHFPDRIVQDKYEPPPPETLELDKLNPLLIGRFDKSDTIHSISPATLFGRAAKCIQFETVNGRTRDFNEVCVDEELGTLMRWNVGSDLVEDSDYFSFEGVLLPAHIRHYINGKLRMEIEQKFTVIEGPIDWAALTPANPQTFHACRPYRRPVIQSAPQPPGAGAGPWYDVQVHAVIGEDGHVRDASVLGKGQDDFEKQAVQIVTGWVFSPGLCNGKPIPVNADLVVHFPPQ